ncbi:DUF732 domain-containing protein [Mycobacterium sp. EPa45]|uniref:DUF732 domain-containing protein n=1 Tax=Mycobacterium sp. EPa45 TaxID=1545728 RepID=UPI0006420B7C|nr:membrane protein [Mycobacterium sp. EPa45]
MSRAPLMAVTTGALLGAATLLTAPPSHADAVAYLLNVTVRPEYNFPNADAALSYGHRLCDKITAGSSYADIVREVKADFQTSDEYQASYLITQGANELCPARIWQLRQSAADYVPGAVP